MLQLAGFHGIAATAGAKSFAHSVSFGLTLAALTNLAQYTAWKAKTRRGTHWHVYGPTYLVSLSIPLVMADLLRHVLQGAPAAAQPHTLQGPVRPADSFLAADSDIWKSRARRFLCRLLR